MARGRALLAAFAVFGTATAAEAAPGGAGGEESWRPERIGVLVYGAEGLGEPARQALEDAVARGLRAVAEGEVRAASERSPVDSGESREILAEADRLLARGQEQIRNLNLEEAVAPLEEAAGLYARRLPELRERDAVSKRLVEAHVQLAIAHFLEGEEEAAREALERAFVLDPALDETPERFPPQLQELVVSTRLLFDERGPGALEIAADVPGAVAYVNGEERGQLPLTLQDLPPGPNFVLVRAPGYRTARPEAVVEGGETRRVEVRLEPAPSRVHGPLAGTRRYAGRPEPADELEQAAGAMRADGFLLLVPVATESAYELTAYLYDLRRSRLVSRARTEAPREEPTEPAAKLARSVWSRAPWETLPAPPPERGPGVFGWVGYQWKRARRHEYFWPAVGAAAGALALGVTFYAANRGLDTGQKVVVLPVIGSF